ncbi:MAG TPA: MFS transporter [Marmoricola sp.]|nr:MFS transporter [Marmoricola sp.]
MSNLGTALDPRSDAGDRQRSGRALVILGIIVLAFNLRPAAVSVGPVLDDLSDSLGMGTVATSLLTSLPVLSFATVGALAPRIGRSVGLHRTTLIALLLVSAGLFARVRVHDQWTFLLLSFVALAGMAVANVLLPSLVKLHFPDQVGTMTALYSTSLAIGLTLASVLTVPISHSRHGHLDWRHGLMVWGVTALIAAVPWVGLVRRDRIGEPATTPIGTSAVARTRLGWVLGVFFGLQSLQAYSIFGWTAKVYRDAGFDAHDAGLLLGVITGVSIPLSLAIPAATVRVKDQRVLLSVIMAFYPIGYLGLIIAPHAGAWVWAVALGIGTCTFPFILTLIGLRARTPAGTAALSAFTQSSGYLIAVLGPFGVGALHAATNGWNVPLAILLALCVPMYAVALMACRQEYVEDQLAA